MNRILRGRHKSQEHSVGNKMKSMVHKACSDMLFKAMLMVITDEAQVRIRFRTNAVPTMMANGLPPMMRKQSTQLRTVGYLRKNCSRTYAV
jgi:hypothetical protein